MKSSSRPRFAPLLLGLVATCVTFGCGPAVLAAAAGGGGDNQDPPPPPTTREGPDESEPNDTFETANSLGNVAIGTLVAAQGALDLEAGGDFFSVEVLELSNFTVTVTPEDLNNVDVVLRTFDDLGLVAEFDFFFNGPETGTGLAFPGTNAIEVTRFVPTNTVESLYTVNATFDAPALGYISGWAHDDLFLEEPVDSETAATAIRTRRTGSGRQ